jgi:hypothetical protein
VYGEEPNHVAWALISIFTCGIAFIGWLIDASTNRVTRVTLQVDPYGNVTAHDRATGCPTSAYRTARVADSRMLSRAQTGPRYTATSFLANNIAPRCIGERVRDELHS